jgi:hypothetical protein
MKNIDHFGTNSKEYHNGNITVDFRLLQTKNSVPRSPGHGPSCFHGSLLCGHREHTTIALRASAITASTLITVSFHSPKAQKYASIQWRTIWR